MGQRVLFKDVTVGANFGEKMVEDYPNELPKIGQRIANPRDPSKKVTVVGRTYGGEGFAQIEVLQD